MIDEIKRFWTKNRTISTVFIIAMAISLSYVAVSGSPGIIPQIEKWYNFLFQLSVAYVVSFVFYVLQVYIPMEQNRKNVNECIKVEIDSIISDMRSPILHMAYTFSENHDNHEPSKEELNAIYVSLNFNKKVNLYNISTASDVTLATCVDYYISKVESDVEKLFQHYSHNIPVDLIKALRDILSSKYHLTMKTMSHSSQGVAFKETPGQDNILIEYQQLYERLKTIKNNL